jgi:NTP pyrophosphatase (non-canonical NTP hydrolase)
MLDSKIEDAHFLNAVANEVVLTRTKYPDNNLLMNALTEEVGELARALLEYYWDPTPEKKTNIKTEAVQVGTMAMRIYSEGDRSLTGNIY